MPALAVHHRNRSVGRHERKQVFESVRDVFTFVSWAPVCLLSVESGRGVNKLMQTVRHVASAHKLRITTDGPLQRPADSPIPQLAQVLLCHSHMMSIFMQNRAANLFL